MVHGSFKFFGLDSGLGLALRGKTLEGKTCILSSQAFFLGKVRLDCLRVREADPDTKARGTNPETVGTVTVDVRVDVVV